jgi:hypothetical protein
VQVGLLAGVVRQLECTPVRVLGLGVGGERGGALGGPDEHLARLGSDLVRVGIVRRGAVRIEVVRCDDLHHLVLVSERKQVLCRGEVQGLPVLPRQHVVGDLLGEVLEEPVLTSLR